MLQEKGSADGAQGCRQRQDDEGPRGLGSGGSLIKEGCSWILFESLYPLPDNNNEFTYEKNPSIIAEKVRLAFPASDSPSHFPIKFLVLIFSLASLFLG
jgi:hypothetical protein